MMVKIAQRRRRVIASPIGPLVGESDGKALIRLAFWDVHDSVSACDGANDPEREDFSECPVLERLARELEEYFAGRRQEFGVPIGARGTDFQQRVWRALRAIPYGSTISYEELARRVGCENGQRAVGGANGANPIAIVVPCHRVIAKGGGLGGYGGGLERKRSLLGLEGANGTGRGPGLR